MQLLKERDEKIRYAIERAAEEVDEVHGADHVSELLDQALGLLREPEQLELWDDKVHTDGIKGIAWTHVSGHHEPCTVDLSDVDLLSKGQTKPGSRACSLKLRMHTSVATGRIEVGAVQKGRRAIGDIILERMGQPRPSKAHSVHHKDNNPLNNRRSNLMWATKAEQERAKAPYGRSKYLYVTIYANGQHEYARGSVQGPDGRKYHGPGRRMDLIPDAEIVAARDGDKLAIQHYGPDARTNVSLGLLDQLPEQLELAL